MQYFAKLLKNISTYHQSLFYKPWLKVKTLYSLAQLLIVENLAILFVKTRALKIHAFAKTTLKRCIDRALIWNQGLFFTFKNGHWWKSTYCSILYLKLQLNILNTLKLYTNTSNSCTAGSSTQSQTHVQCSMHGNAAAREMYPFLSYQLAPLNFHLNVRSHLIHWLLNVLIDYPKPSPTTTFPCCCSPIFPKYIFISSPFFSLKNLSNNKKYFVF